MAEGVRGGSASLDIASIWLRSCSRSGETGYVSRVTPEPLGDESPERNQSMAEDDLVERLLGIEAASPLAALRLQREAIRRHAQGAWRELVLTEAPGGVSPQERAAIALAVARQQGDAALVAECEELAARAGAPPESGRTDLLLRYAAMVAEAPERCGQADIDALVTTGMSPQDIVAVTQLVAFIPFQVRLLAGLRAMQEETGA